MYIERAAYPVFSIRSLIRSDTQLYLFIDEIFAWPFDTNNRIVRKAKRQCWQSFLQGGNKDLNPEQKESAKDRCWIALRCTQPRQHQTTPALKGPNNEIATTMHAKEALVRAHAFPKPPIFPGREVKPARGLMYTQITSKLVEKALLCQSINKAPGPDKLNFRAIRLLWS